MKKVLITGATGATGGNAIKKLLELNQDCRDGVFSGTNDLVEKLTGHKPMRMLDYIVKNKALFVSQQKNSKRTQT
jgi:nucleoside-diphosphate-sugar epimerase